MEPPSEQLFRGRDELLAYFEPLEQGTFLALRGTWFDEASQTGVLEFSFGVSGRAAADHGVAVIELRHGLIASWREYVREGPASFEEFASAEGKQWRWHAGNYP
jgi:hypothetical protein